MPFRADSEIEGGRRLVRLAGWLDRAHADDVARLCDAGGEPVCLDLTDVVSVDESGLATLETLRRRGVELAGASPYLSLRLQAVAGTWARGHDGRPAPESASRDRWNNTEDS